VTSRKVCYPGGTVAIERRSDAALRSGDLAEQKPAILTFDIDWAPDFAIDGLAETLIERRVKSTWFVTHHSPAVDRLRRRPDLFELGLHPNFLPLSTHGATPEEIISHCSQLVPDALSLRTHCLVQSTPLLRTIARTTRIQADVSLFLPGMSGLRPFEQRFGSRSLLRVPFVWEDDVEMDAPAPDWHPKSILELDGLRVFNFHPIHVFLNSTQMDPYRELTLAGKLLPLTTESEAAPLRHHGEGTRTMLESVVEYLGSRPTYCVRDFLEPERTTS
jgi:hypothetical protein